MTTEPLDPAALKARLKELVVEVCELPDIDPADIDDDERLILGGGKLGLGSIDAIEISAAVDKEFGVRIEDLSVARDAFRSISSLAAHIAHHRGWSTDGPA